jgi:pimeloyl-ACP methyl ester carboxylesterase
MAETRGQLALPSATLFVRQWGRDDAPVVLAIHHLGIAGSSLHLAEVGALLAGAYDVRVIAPDLPGFGGSAPLARAEDYRPDALAGLLLELLDRLAIARVAYVGASWGGTIGCHLAARAPQRLTALTLLDAGHVDAADQPGFEVGATLASRMRAARAQLGAFRFRRVDDALNAVSDDYPRWTPQLEESWKAGLRFVDGRVRPRLRPDVYAAAVHGLAVAPPSATWPAIAASGLPVLLLTSDPPADERDRHDAARARFATAVPQADVRIANGYRHDLVAGMGPDLVTLVGDWLRDVDALAGAG